jgi:hypothetical protein
MLDVARIRFVTRYFPQLQGLHAMPWAALSAASLVWDLGWFTWLAGQSGLAGGAYGLVGAALAWLTQWRISGYYRRTYGSVTPDPLVRRTGLTLIAVLGYLAFARLSRGLAGLPDLGAVFVGGCLFWTAYVDRPYRPHFALLATGACLLSVVPIFEWSPRIVQIAYGVALSSGLAIAGIGDHWLLAKTLKGPTLQHAHAS